MRFVDWPRRGLRTPMNCSIEVCLANPNGNMMASSDVLKSSDGQINDNPRIAVMKTAHAQNPVATGNLTK